MASRHQETLKRIHDGLSEEQKLNELMYKKLYQSILRGNKFQASIISKATLILFSKSDVMIADTMFRALWKLGKYREAIKVYLKIGRTIFWYAERIGVYYEKNGLMSKAVQEYEFLMDEYSKMGKNGILPLPNGPPQLFKVGRWYADKDKNKAIKNLRLYLSAEEKCGTDPSFFLRYKNQARRILDRLNSVNE